jgi:hypothetical protein
VVTVDVDDPTARIEAALSVRLAFEVRADETLEVSTATPPTEMVAPDDEPATTEDV